MIENDGTDAVVGAFDGLPEGSLVSINGLSFVISYTGGSDGNDVVLTENSAPTIAAAAASLVVNEGQTLLNSGSFDDS